jgi:hypothetical protein
VEHDDGDVNAGIALMMEAARTSETLVNIYQTTRRYNPEDSHLRTHLRDNLKSYTVMSMIKNKLEILKQSTDTLCRTIIRLVNSNSITLCIKLNTIS